MILDSNKKLISQEILKVIQLIINEELWCKRALARDKDGNQLFDPSDKNACQWCIYGALYALDASTETITYLQNCAKYLGWSDLDRLNDLNQHFYVIQFLKESLEELGVTFIVKIKDYEMGKRYIRKEGRDGK